MYPSDRFHITPLLSFPQAAWLLAISQGAVRLLEVGPSGPPQEVPVPGMPRDAWESSGNRIHRAREAAYARRVDTALREVITGSDLPMILAASQPMAALFRSVNTYPHLVAERQHGSSNTTTDADLAEAARTILDEVYADELAALANLFDERRSQGRTAVDLSNIARLATLGAVDTVMVDIDQTVPGSIDEAGAVTFAEGEEADSYGVVAEIVRRVLLAGGRVLAVRSDDIPEASPAAAILRYVT